MALEPLMFETGSQIFEVTHFNSTKQIGKFNCIQSKHFTVGGYDWVIEFYPLGINELVTKDTGSVAVKVLNPTEEFHATFTFWFWNWTNSTWSGGNFTSELITFSSSGTKARTRWSCDNFITLSTSNLTKVMKDETIRIKCVLNVTPRSYKKKNNVTPRPPAPALPLKPDVDKPAGTNNQGNPSGAASSFDNGFHTAYYAPPSGSNNTKLPRQPTVRIYCQANDELSVTARNGTVVLAPADPNDHYQHWIKDMTYGDKEKDVTGLPAFALVNRVTAEALKNPAGENRTVRLVPYNTSRLDDSVKWTEVWSTGFRAIRIAGTTSLNLTAVASADDDKFSDGAKIVVRKWADNPFQRWMIVPNVFLG